MFLQVVQKALKEGHFKLANRGVVKTAMDVDPFPKLDINMVSYEEPANKGKKMKQAWKPKIIGIQKTKGSIKRTLVFEKIVVTSFSNRNMGT